MCKENSNLEWRNWTEILAEIKRQRFLFEFFFKIELLAKDKNKKSTFFREIEQNLELPQHNNHNIKDTIQNYSIYDKIGKRDLFPREQMII